MGNYNQMKIQINFLGMFSLIFLLFSCETDINENLLDSSSSEPVFKRIKISTLTNDSEFVNIYSRIGKLKVRNDEGMQNRSLLENNYAFTIIDSTVNVVEYGGKKSYSFLIKKDSLDHTKFQNLLVEIESPTSSKFTIIDYEKSILGDGSNRETYDAIKMIDITLDPSVITSSQQRLNCTTIIVIFCTATGTDLYCGGADTKHGCWKISSTECINSESAGESAPGQGNYGDTTIAVPNPGPQGGSLGNGNVTPYPDTPCGSLQKKASEFDFKRNFKALNTTANYAQNYEQGFFEKKDNTGKAITVFRRNPNGTKDLPVPDGSYSYTHTHTNWNTSVDADGNEIVNSTVKMPSPADLIQLLTKCKSNALLSNVPYTDTYGMMFSSEGIFAIKPLQANFDTITLNDSQKDFQKEYEEIAKEILLNNQNTVEQRKELLQKMFLNLLKKHGLEGKVGLFEATSETDLESVLPKITWKQKTLNANGDLIETEC